MLLPVKKVNLFYNKFRRCAHGYRKREQIWNYCYHRNFLGCDQNVLTTQQHRRKVWLRNGSGQAICVQFSSERTCRSSLLSHQVTVLWQRVNQTQYWPCNARSLVIPPADTWHYGIRARTGCPGVSMLCLYQVREVWWAASTSERQHIKWCSISFPDYSDGRGFWNAQHYIWSASYCIISLPNHLIYYKPTCLSIIPRPSDYHFSCAWHLVDHLCPSMKGEVVVGRQRVPVSYMPECVCFSPGDRCRGFKEVWPTNTEQKKNSRGEGEQKTVVAVIM